MAITAGADTHAASVPQPLDLGPAPAPTQMPINPTERNWRVHRGSNTLSDRALDALRTTRQSAARLYAQTRRRAADSYSRLSERSGELTQQTRSVARYARHEYPLQLLGVIAGTAFLAGVALRIWRSR